MKYSEAELGRIFILRLEDGDRLPDVIEKFAAAKGVLRAACLFLGGVDDGSRLVVGPADGGELPPEPVLLALAGVHEAAGVGTLFPDDEGRPSLHMHAACGRGESTRTGCVRPGVDVWKVGEVIIIELTGTEASRRKDEATGFALLSP